MREIVDWLFDNVFCTVAFQSALVCTYAEAVQEGLGSIDQSTSELLAEYVEAINSLLRPKNVKDLKNLCHTFIGELSTEDTLSLKTGGATFRNVVLAGEMQPAEWPKYRYLILELWKPSNEMVAAVVEKDRNEARKDVASALYKRKLSEYCDDQRLDVADLSDEQKSELLEKCKQLLEGFIAPVFGRKVKLPDAVYLESLGSAQAHSSGNDNNSNGSATLGDAESPATDFPSGVQRIND